MHLLTDRNGLPLTAKVTPANGDERRQVFPLLDGLDLPTGGKGRRKKRPKTLAADKGYDRQPLRQALRDRGIRPEIPKREWKSRRKPWGA
ncbi:MAG: hypothetical protein D6795_17340 [Deltaproteobacteria bacterium]|nr:MAG: hypothetical protein D6795_17340 [Deltaproteobacteria bacterium]